jgi:SAM-dependent methyltransferase
MLAAMDDPTQRFAGRAQAYASFRPTYPAEVLQVLERECGLTPECVVADVGFGTGKLTALLLAHGCRVYAVEPDPGMRAVAERELGHNPRFTSVAGRAEATTLPDCSVDLVTAAQAFHWFDVPRTRAELARSLRPGGSVALIWNTRRTDTSPFLRAYESFLREHGTDYAPQRHGRADPDALRAFFGVHGWRKTSIEHADTLDLAALQGRVHSASYMPAPGTPGHEAMQAALTALFRAHQEDRAVSFAFDTEIYSGRIE